MLFVELENKDATVKKTTSRAETIHELGWSQMSFRSNTDEEVILISSKMVSAGSLSKLNDTAFNLHLCLLALQIASTVAQATCRLYIRNGCAECLTVMRRQQLCPAERNMVRPLGII